METYSEVALNEDFESYPPQSQWYLAFLNTATPNNLVLLCITTQNEVNIRNKLSISICLSI